MDIYLLITIIIISFVICTIILFIKTYKKSSNISDDYIKELCNDELIDDILNHLYKSIKNEHSIYENMILSELAQQTIYELNKFYNLSSCDSNLELKQKDFVIKNSSRVGSSVTIDIAVNTINLFYIYNNISNSIIYGNKENLSGINVDIVVELCKPIPSNSNKPLIKIDKIFLTKNTELKF